MGAGELREIAVQSTYMHGQGLMVPVVGKLSVENGEDGLPAAPRARGRGPPHDLTPSVGLASMPHGR